MKYKGYTIETSRHTTYKGDVVSSWYCQLDRNHKVTRGCLNVLKSDIDYHLKNHKEDQRLTNLAMSEFYSEENRNKYLYNE